MKLSIIVPAYNEQNTIVHILEKVNKQNNKDCNLEVIVIDDNSTDSTKELLENNPSLYTKFISLEKNLGKGGAVKAGLKFATGSHILFQDADLEYNPEEYEKIIKIIKNFDADLVIGSRFLSPEYTRVHYFFHKLGNKFITGLFNLIYNTTFTDIYSCYLCFKKDLINPAKLKSNGWSQQAEILATVVSNSKVFYEVPISYSGRTFEEGKKIKARHAFSVVYMILKKRLF
ncbi:MAG: glycosyltransferase [bacterium TMED80]|nr:MAG: glycosyltransferase [bacterium TMED80]|tara:strand:+ start:129 stop:818 length:690 start_codon:yes stop_codon:yes gene_type:complete